MSDKQRRNELGQRTSVALSRLRSYEEEVVFGEPGLFRELILLATILRLKQQIISLTNQAKRGNP